MAVALNWLWQGCVVALMTLAALRVLERSTARTRYLVCWAALAAVVVLPGLALVRAAFGPVLEVAAPGTSAALAAVPSTWWRSSTVVVMSAWALWVVVGAARVAVAMWAIGRTKAGYQPFPASLQSQLLHWERVRARGRRVRLVLSDRVRAGAVLGCGSPVIAIAPAILRRLTPDELDRVVIHEWAHVQRRDDLANALQLAMGVVAGWHPAVRWLDRRIHLEREAACDELVVKTTGSAKSYAACLVKLAGMPFVPRQPLSALGALSAPTLAVRLRRLMVERKSLSPVVSVASVAVAVAFVCAGSVAASSMRLVVMAAEAADARTPPPAAPVRTLTAVQSAVSPAHPVPRRSRPLPARTSPRLELAVLPANAVSAQITSPDVISAGMAVETAVVVADPVSVAPTAVEAGQAEASTSPWTAAAQAGRAVGQGSARAGVATAGFVTRLGKNLGKGIAGSF